MPVSAAYRAAPRFAQLGEGFAEPVGAAAFPQHVLRFRNQRHAATVGLQTLSDAEWLAHFGRFDALPDNQTQPLAMRYHGHQFRHYNAFIGDGRGFLFAQLRDAVGRLLDLGTKGSGATPYARDGDGRLTLQGGVREVLASEMLEALGVPTSKGFSLVETGELRTERGVLAAHDGERSVASQGLGWAEALYRSDEPSPTRSCVLVRLSHSHVRYGTFQCHHFDERPDRLEALLRHCVALYFADRLDPRAPLTELAPGFLAEVSDAGARLAAAWTVAGFAHGVLNTDNMSITGEGFDYGPWRFVPDLDPAFVAAYFDATGLYAFGRQPRTIFWNLDRLGDALDLLAPRDTLREALAGYEGVFQTALGDRLCRRLGVDRLGDQADAAFAFDVMAWLDTARISADRFYFDWFGGAGAGDRPTRSPLATLYQDEAFADLATRLRARDAAHPGTLADPYLAGDTPCSMLNDEVRAIWAAIADDDDWTLFTAKVAAVRRLGDLLSGTPGR